MMVKVMRINVHECQVRQTKCRKFKENVKNRIVNGKYEKNDKVDRGKDRQVLVKKNDKINTKGLVIVQS